MSANEKLLAGLAVTASVLAWSIFPALLFAAVYLVILLSQRGKT